MLTKIALTKAGDIKPEGKVSARHRAKLAMEKGTSCANHDCMNTACQHNPLSDGSCVCDGSGCTATAESSAAPTDSASAPQSSALPADSGTADTAN